MAAVQLVTYLWDATERIAVAMTSPADGVVIVAVPIVMLMDPMFDDGKQHRRDMLRETIIRMVRSGKLDRDRHEGKRWSRTRYQAIYTAWNGTRVPVDIRLVTVRSWDRQSAQWHREHSESEEGGDDDLSCRQDDC